MKTRAPSQLRRLDLETLDRVIGGCRLVVVPSNTNLSSSEPVKNDARIEGFALAASDAWASLRELGPAVTHERLATVIDSLVDEEAGEP